jgi:hypothetical protein
MRFQRTCELFARYWYEIGVVGHQKSPSRRVLKGLGCLILLRMWI